MHCFAAQDLDLGPDLSAVILASQTLLADIEHALTHHLHSAVETEGLPGAITQIIISTITDNSCHLHLRLVDAWSRAQLEERVDSQFVVPDGVRWVFQRSGTPVKVVCRSIVMMPCRIPGKLLECLLQLWCKPPCQVMQVRPPFPPAPLPVPPCLSVDPTMLWAFVLSRWQVPLLGEKAIP